MAHIKDEKERLAAVLLRNAIRLLERVVRLSDEDQDALSGQSMKLTKESLRKAREARAILGKRQERKRRKEKS